MRLHFPIEDKGSARIKRAPSFDEQIAASETTNEALVERMNVT